MIARVSTVAFQGVDVLDIGIQVQMASGLPAKKGILEAGPRSRSCLHAQSADVVPH